jgi:hypothetical protein
MAAGLLDLRGLDLASHDSIHHLCSRWDKSAAWNAMSLECSTVSPSSLRLLGSQLAPFRSIVQLCLRDIHLTAHGLKILMPFINQQHDLQELDLGRNELEDEGAAVLAGALDRAPSLASLDLENNKISSKGLESLSPYIFSLTALSLSHNPLGDAGVTELCGALERCSGPSLQVLGLCSVGCSSKCAASLAKMLVKNRSLKRLDLKANTIGNQGLDLLVAALQDRSNSGGNSTVQDIDLRWNYVGGEDLDRLQALLQSNRTHSTSTSANNGGSSNQDGECDVVGNDATSSATRIEGPETEEDDTSTTISTSTSVPYPLYSSTSSTNVYRWDMQAAVRYIHSTSNTTNSTTSTKPSWTVEDEQSISYIYSTTSGSINDSMVEEDSATVTSSSSAVDNIYNSAMDNISSLRSKLYKQKELADNMLVDMLSQDKVISNLLHILDSCTITSSITSDSSGNSAH